MDQVLQCFLEVIEKCLANQAHKNVPMKNFVSFVQLYLYKMLSLLLSLSDKRKE